jgi:hypothetical protein
MWRLRQDSDRIMMCSEGMQFLGIIVLVKIGEEGALQVCMSAAKVIDILGNLFIR